MATSTLPGHVLWEDTIHGGASWSLNLRRGNALRIEDIEGGANVATLLYNLDCPVERYNMPDTLKAQHIAHLTKGFVLYSDMGRVLASVVEDTVGWHDPLCSFNDAAAVKAKYGEATYQVHRNEYHRNTFDNLVVEAEKHGLSVRDLGPSLNLFSKIRVDADGSMNFVPGNSKAGDSVTLRADMNLLVMLDTGQHALDPNPAYAPKPVKISVLSIEPRRADDPCLLSRPENARGFINTDRYFA